MAFSCRAALGACVLALSLLAWPGLSDPVCDKLLQPVDAGAQLEGKWLLVAGSERQAEQRLSLQRRESTYIVLRNRGDGVLAYEQANHEDGKCEYRVSNLTLEGGAFRFHVGVYYNLTGTTLPTSCGDCLVVRWHLETSHSSSDALFLLSKRRELEQAHLEEYKAQARCMQMADAVVMLNPAGALCPEKEGLDLVG